jgi:hypothetical protein
VQDWSHAETSFVTLRRTLLELGEEVPPLVLHLPCGDRSRQEPRVGEHRSVEVVASLFSLISNESKIVIDGCRRYSSASSETVELRMVAVTSRLSQQNFSTQKSFSPQADEALSIEMTRMEAPKAHALLYSSQIVR